MQEDFCEPIPRFMTADGSRPQAKRPATSQKPFHKYTVPGPKSIKPNRIYQPVMSHKQDEASPVRRRKMVVPGPRIQIASLSDDDDDELMITQRTTKSNGSILLAHENNNNSAASFMKLRVLQTVPRGRINRSSDPLSEQQPSAIRTINQTYESSQSMSNVQLPHFTTIRQRRLTEGTRATGTRATQNSRRLRSAVHVRNGGNDANNGSWRDDQFQEVGGDSRGGGQPVVIPDINALLQVLRRQGQFKIGDQSYQVDIESESFVAQTSSQLINNSYIQQRLSSNISNRNFSRDEGSYLLDLPSDRMQIQPRRSIQVNSHVNNQMRHLIQARVAFSEHAGPEQIHVSQTDGSTELDHFNVLNHSYERDAIQNRSVNIEENNNLLDPNLNTPSQLMSVTVIADQEDNSISASTPTNLLSVPADVAQRPPIDAPNNDFSSSMHSHLLTEEEEKKHQETTENNRSIQPIQQQASTVEQSTCQQDSINQQNNTVLGDSQLASKTLVTAETNDANLNVDTTNYIPAVDPVTEISAVNSLPEVETIKTTSQQPAKKKNLRNRYKNFNINVTTSQPEQQLDQVIAEPTKTDDEPLVESVTSQPSLLSLTKSESMLEEFKALAETQADARLSHVLAQLPASLTRKSRVISAPVALRRSSTESNILLKAITNLNAAQDKESSLDSTLTFGEQNNPVKFVQDRNFDDLAHTPSLSDPSFWDQFEHLKEGGSLVPVKSDTITVNANAGESRLKETRQTGKFEQKIEPGMKIFQQDLGTDPLKNPFAMLNIHKPELKKASSQIDRKTMQKMKLAEAIVKFAEIQSADTYKETRVDLVFLHASPNLFTSCQLKSSLSEKCKKQLFELPALNFRKEAQTIKEALQESGRQIYFQSKVATRDSIEETIRKRPNVLHISCHGVRNNFATMGQNFDLHKERGHLLLFEDQNGDGELVSAQELREFMQQANTELEVVFVAACDSQGIGHIFQRCGAKHVVCVEQDRYVLDEAAIYFTKTFYSLLFKGENICEAFEAAKRAVKFKIRETEANLFMLLLAEDHQKDGFLRMPGQKSSTVSQHQCCYPLPKAQEGAWQCISDHNLVKQIPARLTNIQFREREMSKLLSFLFREGGSRIVPVIGLQGIGKSSLARNTLHYVCERKMFTHGILFIQLKDMRACFTMLKLLMRALLKFLNIESSGKRKLLEKTNSKNAMIDYLAKFFNNKQEQCLRKQGKVDQSKAMGNRKFLLCLDNAEVIIQNDKDEFVAFLTHILDQCPNLYLIVTSTRDFGALTNQNNSKPFLLQRLKFHDSVKLFLENCGSVQSNDVYQLVLQDKNFPFKKFLSHVKDLDELSFEQVSELLRRKIENPQNWVSALAQHDMFKQLLGNPLSITMIAAIHCNPMIKKSEGSTLVDMYERIKSEKNIVIEELDYDVEGKVIPRVIENIMSLKVAAEMSVKLLESTQLDDINLLYFLGCLPGGVSEIQLTSMYGLDELTDSLERLRELSFLEVGVEKLMLTPSIMSYIGDTLLDESKNDYMQRICDFYQGLLYESYKQFGRMDMREYYEGQAEVDIGTPKSVISVSSFYSSFPKKKGLKESLLRLGNTFNTDQEQKSIFEQVANDLPNIENCLNYLINKSATLQQTDQETEEDADFQRLSSNTAMWDRKSSFADKLNGREECISELTDKVANKASIEFDKLLLDYKSSSGRSSEKVTHKKGISVDSSNKTIRRLQSEIIDSDPSRTSMTDSSQSILQQSQTSQFINQSDKLIGGSRKSEDMRTKPISVVSQDNHYIRRKTQILNEFAIKGMHAIEEEDQQDSDRQKRRTSSSNKPKLQKKMTNKTIMAQSTKPFISLNSFVTDPGIDHQDQSNQVVKPPKQAKDIITSQNVDDPYAYEYSEESRSSSSLDRASGTITTSSEQEVNVSMSNKKENETTPEQEDKDQEQDKSQSETDQAQSTLENFQLKNSGTFGRRQSNQYKELLNPADLIFSKPMPAISECSDNNGNRVPFNRQISQWSKMSCLVSLGIGERRISDSSDDDSVDSKQSSSHHSNSEEEEDQKSESLLSMNKSIHHHQHQYHHQKSEELLRKSNTFMKELPAARGDNDFFNELIKRNQTCRPSGSDLSSVNNDQLRRPRKLTCQELSADQTLVDTVRQKMMSMKQLIIGRHKKNQNNELGLLSVEEDKSSHLQTTLAATVGDETTKDNVKECEEPMTIQGRFIIFLVAGAYLTHDYYYTLRICQQNFSKFATSQLFMGNKHRFTALAHIKLAQLSLEDEATGLNQCLAHLTKAIDELQSALQIYKPQRTESLNSQVVNVNHYGTGLSQFSLGYLYEKFATSLSSSQQIDSSSIEIVGKHLVDSHELCQAKACQLFQDAYLSFKKRKHLRGMLSAKTHEASLLKKERQKKKMILKQHRLEQKYIEYCLEVGIEQSSHIPREEHGPDFSLMTEIVQDNNNQVSLFPEDDDDEIIQP